jgi:hypothetical protein
VMSSSNAAAVRWRGCGLRRRVRSGLVAGSGRRHDSGSRRLRSDPFADPHGAEPRLGSSVVALEAVVRMLRGVVERVGEKFVDDAQQGTPSSESVEANCESGLREWIASH